MPSGPPIAGRCRSPIASAPEKIRSRCRPAAIRKYGGTGMSAQQPKGAHLNGSVPLGNSETVFRTVSSTLGDRLRRIPDGETGVRTNWIGFQSDAFAATEKFDLVPPDPKSYAPLPFFTPRAGADPRQIRFGRPCYAHAAKASYEKFPALKRDGQTLSGIRFQVNLQTPL